LVSFSLGYTELLQINAMGGKSGIQF